ncbi:Beta-galactosidase 17 [Striga hermonthica]|uniref:Beta-galactosidase n=1 Tax=Striga hermonthica TaxID=68872 RepID=A0A9N7N601_STRHE|nr:Beta-galactosidase 17 [Striga hermonthica]
MGGFTAKIFVFSTFVIVLGAFAPLPSASNHADQLHMEKLDERKFEIAEDMFWKDGEPFRIIGGDLHYFRVHPEYWEDRLMRAKALGLNTIQTYVPWNLHEPKQGHFVFEDIADILSFIGLCKKLNLLVMLRAGPYICGEWDLGGFPAWLLAEEPAIRLRSSDPAFLNMVEKWWGILLPKVSPFLYTNGGPIIMVQVENEFGSYGDDKDYLHYLVELAKRHLGDDVILYTTDGAVDFSTGEDSVTIFELQKEFNSPGKSPRLSSEFYTGWLTHWGENIASTDANFTAANLEKIFSNNGSAVLYMAHGGTNFGFYSGANTGSSESDYKADLTSYDYDAPIRESGDVDNEKYKALRSVIAKYSTEPLPPIPPDNEKIAYGHIKLDRVSFLFNTITARDLIAAVEYENPISMEAFGQMFGLVLYVSDYTSNDNGNVLQIPKVHDRAQVFVYCPEYRGKRPTFVNVITRWSNRPINLPYLKCESKCRLFILVENMGRLNYGPYIFDRKGILSSVYLDEQPLYKWKTLPVSFQKPSQVKKADPIIPNDEVKEFVQASARKKLRNTKLSIEPAFYSGQFEVDKVGDTYLSFGGWSKGVAFVNDVNVGRFWPSVGPQCSLYVPAPILRQGNNTLVILELETASPDLFVRSVENADFSCAPRSSELGPETAAVAAAVTAAAAAPSFTPPAAFIAPPILAKAAIPPTSIALNATVGFIDII